MRIPHVVFVVPPLSGGSLCFGIPKQIISDDPHMAGVCKVGGQRFNPGNEQVRRAN
jgi:hypothetical protein